MIKKLHFLGVKDPNLELPGMDAEILEDLLDGIASGRYGPDKLPKKLFGFTFMALAEQLAKLFGLPSDFTAGTAARATAELAKANLGIFSGAKTFQQVVELSLAVFNDDGTKKPFLDFVLDAMPINSKYNIDYLRAEQNAVFRQAQAMENWQQIQEQADVLPLLRYVTVGDERVRPEHAEQDQIVKPHDSDYWDTWFPPNGWNCRCIVEQLPAGGASITPGDEVPENENPNFSTNVGKTGLVFSDKHPYNDIPKEFKKQASSGFGFTVPTDKAIKDFIKP